jgi:hypothetical protein
MRWIASRELALVVRGVTERAWPRLLLSDPAHPVLAQADTAGDIDWAVSIDSTINRALVLEVRLHEPSVRMAQGQWLIGSPATGARKVGSRDMASEPT